MLCVEEDDDNEDTVASSDDERTDEEEPSPPLLERFPKETIPTGAIVETTFLIVSTAFSSFSSNFFLRDSISI